MGAIILCADQTNEGSSLTLCLHFTSPSALEADAQTPVSEPDSDDMEDLFDPLMTTLTIQRFSIFLTSWRNFLLGVINAFKLRFEQ
jgi:hypothetical protein